MKKNKKIQLIQKKINWYIKNGKKNITKFKKIAKSFKTSNKKLLKLNSNNFKIIIWVFIFLIFIFIVSNLLLKREVVKNIDSISNKNTILKLSDNLINNKLYINEESNKLLWVNVTNIWWKDLVILTQDKKIMKKLDTIYCNLNLTDYKNNIQVITSNESTLKRWNNIELFFEINSNIYEPQWNLEINLDCSENWKRNEKYSNKMIIDYKKIHLNEKNILILNTSLNPISKNLSDFYEIYSNNGNKVKFMSSHYKSDLKNYKELDLTNKITFYYKEKPENLDIFKSMFDNISKSDEFNYIKWYEIMELSQKNIKDLYFLWDCENVWKKCNPYTTFDKFNIYYNYFSPKLLDNTENNIDFIILIPAKFDTK